MFVLFRPILGRMDVPKRLCGEENDERQNYGKSFVFHTSSLSRALYPSYPNNGNMEFSSQLQHARFAPDY